MTSLDLFQREHELIFNRCWIYLGHESEVESPGDYRRRTVAGQPLFFVRSKDGQVRVFLNSCPHRGAMICRHDEGNAKTLQCFYHAWSFNTSGELVAVPGRDAYGPHFDPGEHGLKAPPRVDNYRGFLFVSFNPDVEDLVTYLAEARDYLDLVVDQAEKGMRVISGSNKYAIKANWKLLAENSLDGYHLVPTHRTYVDYITGLGTDDSGESLAARPPGAGRALGNGHCVSENISRNGRPIARWHPVFGEEAKPRIEKVRRRLAQKYGEERAYRMADTSRNLLIYPNLLIMDFVAISIR
ncbi:MAG: Rieske 2Fe-2S domain-containing protein, partial [Gammaproteobacteria bacterium]|nr:Rieske 2Fe-2S domain-containing protein [Gammaproteobacteria bacterium]